MAGFTAIAAGVGMAASAGTTGMTFSQAAKSKDNQIKADEETSKMMQEARRRVNVNPFAAISLPTEAYKLESESNLQQGALLTQAGRESERGIAATAGRVQAAQQQGQQEIRAQQAQDKYKLDIATAEEAANIRNKLVGIDLAEAEGAQVAAGRFANQYNQLIKQGVQGIADIAGKAAEAAPLFEQTAGAKQFDKFEKEYGKMVTEGTVPKELISKTGEPLSAADAFAKISINPKDYSKLGKNVKRIDEYGEEYQAFEVNPFQLREYLRGKGDEARYVRKSLKNEDENVFYPMDIYETDLPFFDFPKPKTSAK